jgi:hypothetical protein
MGGAGIEQQPSPGLNSIMKPDALKKLLEQLSEDDKKALMQHLPES